MIVELLKIKHPDLLGNLEPGATLKDINELELKIGRTLPEELKVLYQSINSPVGLIYGLYLIPVEEVAGRIMNHALRFTDKYVDPLDESGGLRIPIFFDYSRVWLFIDYAPTPLGVKGQVVLVNYEYGTGIKLFDSFSEMINQFEKDIKDRKYNLVFNEGEYDLKPVDEIDISFIDYSKSL